MNSKWLVGLLTILLAVAGAFAQGNVTSASKDDWEEVNFEFNSAVLSDGYPSLLRLAEVLKANPGYRVKVEGHTDWVGSPQYNEKLAAARANTVREFLVKYGALSAQVQVAGFGKAKPKVDNRSKEGRFMNRRVELTLSDAQGRVIGAGGVGDILKALNELAKKQEECCSQILKKLDKLDDILAAIRDLKSENDRLKQDVADLKAAQAGLKKEVAEAPRAPSPADVSREVARTAGAEVKKALDEALPKPNQKFSLLGLNAGPTTRTGELTFTGKGRFFSPFGDGTHAVQAEGEYMYYRNRQEGQFDLGLVNRWKNFQAGMFSSFKYVNIGEYQRGGVIGQGAISLDYIFSRGRLGMFGTKGFLDNAVVNRTQLGPTSYLENYLRIVDQIGGSTQVGLFGNSYVEGNLGYLKSHAPGRGGAP